MSETPPIPIENERFSHDKLPALEAQIQGLQLLVSDLLRTNQNLRAEVARLLLDARAEKPEFTA